MQVLTFQELPAIPSLGALVGSSGSADLLSSISRQWGDGGTHFGKPGDLFLDNQMAFLRGIIDPATQAINAMKKVASLFCKASEPPIIAITEPEQLSCVPPSMILPILTMPIMREQLAAGNIHGFGFATSDLPVEDDTGRILNNGRCQLEPGKVNELVWIMKSIDPKYTVDELDMLRSTREFLQWFMEQQLKAPQTERIDPTDYPNPMGKLK